MPPGVHPSFADPIGVFPLPNVVLMPGAVLPLQIFEPRYRAMIRDALDDHRLIAMALLCPGFEAYYYTNMARIHPMVCVGRIRDYARVPDGRYFINLVGVCRARVESEDHEGEYRTAILEPVIQPSSGIDQDGEYLYRYAIRELLGSPLLNSVQGVPALRQFVQSTASLGEVVDRVAGALLPPENVEVKQRLLDELEVIPRARILRVELQRLLKALELRQGIVRDWPRLGSEN